MVSRRHVVVAILDQELRLAAFQRVVGRLIGRVSFSASSQPTLSIQLFV